MGKTKIKIIDYSKPEEEVKKKPAKKTKPDKVERVKVDVANGEKIEDGKLKLVVEGGKMDDGEKKAQEMGKQVNLPTSNVKKSSSTIHHPSSKKIRSKKYLEKIKLVDPNQKYPLAEAIKLMQDTSYSKFPGTVEVHLNTTVKNLRGLVTLPFTSGKKLKVLAFGPSAGESGADIMGTDDTVSEIEKGKINFDVVVTTPEWMPKLAKVAKILGPKGLMPNPKNGTITQNLAKTVADLQGGKTEFKTQTDAQVIHLGVGKINQQSDEIAANIKALYQTIGKSKINKITLSPSMGPGVKVDLSSI